VWLESRAQTEAVECNEDLLRVGSGFRQSEFFQRSRDSLLNFRGGIAMQRGEGRRAHRLPAERDPHAPVASTFFVDG
jgi:hypothetical protein